MEQVMSKLMRGCEPFSWSYLCLIDGDNEVFPVEHDLT